LAAIVVIGILRGLRLAQELEAQIVNSRDAGAASKIMEAAPTLLAEGDDVPPLGRR